MCLILLALDARPDYPLVVAANRDEFYTRPTAPAGWWDDAPGVLAGRDLRGGGTWMGVSRGGRFAAVTNYRDTLPVSPDAPSRGHLVGGFLRGGEAPEAYLRALEGRAGEYAGFNLLVGEGGRLWYFGNRGGEPPRELVPGVYGVSNALLDTPWPKVERGKAGLRAILGGGGPVDPEALFRLLWDAEPAADPLLPDTGVGIELERVLSSPFIRSPEYGTRASTVLLAGRGAVTLVERGMAAGEEGWTERRFTFAASPAAAGQ
ncbi:MAG TPA: NRDE family protein [Longimicrobiaceae bacterium]|nr:NRDE family protein [Longimicrobiaceae bacterium]